MRLLLVEDDPLLAKTLQQQLQRHFAVDTVNNYRAAVLQLRTLPYAVLVVDWVLPDGEGVELCRLARREQLNLPILMLTGRHHVADRVAGLESGADDYLTKPFAPPELLARLQALLRRHPGLTTTSELVLGPLKLNTRSCQVTTELCSAKLSRTEFLILELLLRHPKQIISKTIFWDQVWDYHHEPSSNSLEVHIKNLRHKLESLTHQVRLRAVKGLGYTLELLEPTRLTDRDTVCHPKSQ